MSLGRTGSHSRGDSLDPRYHEENRQILLHCIEEHFSRHKPYLRPDYSSLDLSNELNVCYQYLSYVINKCMGMTFKDFLNSHRVAHAMDMMRDPQAHLYTLEWLGRQSGFRSRTTFFRAFQRKTGQPPSRVKRSGAVTY